MHYRLTSVIFCLFVHLATIESAYVAVDQGKLYYQKFGQGTPIIVVHGGPGLLDQGYLLPQLLELASTHQLIFYDQRGSGHSLETEMGPEYINLDQFTEDLEALRKALGLNKVVLMGHSWGGFLSMHYAVTYPEHLSGLILLNTLAADCEGQTAFVEELIARIRGIRGDLAPFFTFEEFKKLDGVQLAALYRKLLTVYFYEPSQVNELSLTVSPDSAQSGFLVNEELSKTCRCQPSTNLFPSLEKLEVPTLIIHGREDLMPLWTAEKIHAALPHSEIVIVEHCGHFPYIEQPSEFFREVSQFLNTSCNPTLSQ